MFGRVMLVCLGLSLGAAMGQEAKPAAAEAPLPSVDTLPKNYAVFRQETECPRTAAKAGAGKHCETVVTREQFEEMVSAVNPKMTPKERREFAENYARLLALSREAERRGLTRDPRVEAMLKYARMTALASAMSKELYREAQNPSDAAVEKYFRQNQAFFVRYKFERIFVPREKQGRTVNVDPAKDLEAQLATPSSDPSEEMKALADTVHQQALAGEQFAALQERVFDVAGIKTLSDVKMELEPGQVPKSQNAAFDLKVGEISAVLPDTTGFYIYKLVGRETPTLKEARQEVVLRMQNHTVNEALQNIAEYGKTKINEDYFNKYEPPTPNPNEPDVDTD